MTVCLDTNVLLQIFGRRHPFYPILRALLDGRLTSAVSTEILLEYEEVTVKSSGVERWHDIAAFFEVLAQVHGNIRYIDSHFRFDVIVTDPDDNKFCDCAIVAEADYVVTDDHHFDALNSAGYKPRAISPTDFIRLHLSGNGQ
ncbi:MAG: putative toxin-antitoxin system toxin component, PIN family [Verrucomicrobia bacterium]|nr:putative toxin-antitoxin system toxin component, PIN family [Verrucomicrobiota bacterium]